MAFHFIPNEDVQFEEYDIHIGSGLRQRFDYGIMLDIPGNTGDNFTGISIGGFGASSRYFIASASIAPGFRPADDRNRNIYTLVLPREFEHYDTGRRIRIATFERTNRIASIPVMTQVGYDSFALMWEEYQRDNSTSQGFVLQFIDGNGEAVG